LKIEWNRDAGKALCGGKEFVITSDVRNELNGRRRLHDPDEVKHIVTADGRWGDAYMPRPFPVGQWEVVGIEETSSPEFAPIKIKTNAHQKVERWNLDGRGGYEKASGVFVEDYGYHLHWSEHSKTTLGCGRVGTFHAREVVELAKMIQAAWRKGETVFLEVV
jgi:hypothetical protein